jgi:tripartite-type tricarboxylate transporter receptor subunit TctC
MALLGLWLGLVPADAQDWPTKTVKIIVPFGPGSTD